MIDVEEMKSVYYYHGITGRYIADGCLDEADRNQNTGEWVLPGNCTDQPPPMAVGGRWRKFDAIRKAWGYEDVRCFVGFREDGRVPNGFWDDEALGNYIPLFAEQVSRADYDLYRTGEYARDLGTNKPIKILLGVLEHGYVDQSILDLAEVVIMQEERIVAQELRLSALEGGGAA